MASESEILLDLFLCFFLLLNKMNVRLVLTLIGIS